MFRIFNTGLNVPDIHHRLNSVSNLYHSVNISVPKFYRCSECSQLFRMTTGRIFLCCFECSLCCFECYTQVDFFVLFQTFSVLFRILYTGWVFPCCSECSPRLNVPQHCSEYSPPVKYVVSVVSNVQHRLNFSVLFRMFTVLQNIHLFLRGSECLLQGEFNCCISNA